MSSQEIFNYFKKKIFLNFNFLSKNLKIATCQFTIAPRGSLQS